VRWLRLIRPALLGGLLFSGCVSAKINVVDERTALENQILGSYQRLDRDMQLLASVRAGEKAKPGAEKRPLVDARRRAIQARRVIQFNADDVDELKRLGCLGETKAGKLAGHDCEATSDAAVKKRLDRLVESENEARAVILSFIVTESPDLTEKNLPQLKQAFVRMRREDAKAGEWIQLDSGAWQKK